MTGPATFPEANARAAWSRRSGFPRFFGRVTLALFVAGTAGTALAATPMTTLDGSIAVVAPTPPGGVIDPNTPTVTRQTLRADELAATIAFDVSLKMRNSDELQTRVQAGGRVSFAEMAAKYEPLASDYQAVSAWLTAQGFQLTFSDPSHLCVFARGTVAQIQQAMRVRLARVTLQGEEYTSAITAPSVPSSLAPLLVGVNGLQPHIRMHKHPTHPGHLTTPLKSPRPTAPRP
jgi:hypothetical protein